MAGLRIDCPFCKREVAVRPRQLTIWLHRRAGYQCPGSGRVVLPSQLRLQEKKRIRSGADREE